MIGKGFIISKTRCLLNEFIDPIAKKTDKPRQKFQPVPLLLTGNSIDTISLAVLFLLVTDSESYEFKMDQPKRRSAQQARHNHLRFAYGAASARLRLAS
ncbi:hypothetical protein ACFL3Q_03460 [Planctomycetota bacterium]